MNGSFLSDNQPKPLNWQQPLPLEGWFLAARSSHVRRGSIIPFELSGQPVVIYRGEDDAVRALPAHCPHMGAHLQNGTVVGSAIQCPLHHWRWKVGNAAQTTERTQCVPGLVAREYGGGIWLCNKPGSIPPPFPEASDAAQETLCFHHGKTVFLAAPWQAIMANAFDLNHFQTVHQRALLKDPSIEISGDKLNFDYTSMAVGSDLADRVMRVVSGNQIQVAISLWHGSVITVRTRVKRRDTFLWLSALPVAGGTLVKPVYAVRRGEFLSSLRLRLAAWLFDAFLKKDVKILDQISFAPNVTKQEDRYLWTYLQFVEQLASSAQIQCPNVQPNEEETA